MINVLSHALPLVNIVHPNVTMTCRRYRGSVVDEAGIMNPFWDEFEAQGQFQIQHSQQQVSQEMNVGHAGATVWIMAELHTVETQAVADQILYKGLTYNVVGVDNWNPGNGWGSYTITLDKTSDMVLSKGA